jgi:serine/threonine protein kinase
MTMSPSDPRTPPKPAELPARPNPAETDTIAPTLSGQDPAPTAFAPTQFLAPAQQPDEIGRLGKYRVLKELGRGGMGAVFLAEDPHLKRTVALKVMLPEVAASQSSRERFLREARAAAAIEHENIVTLYEVAEDRGVPFLAMQFLRGMSLDDYLRKGKPFTWTQIFRVGREIARGLDAAHQRGLIHRDIKPANIWLDAAAGGRVRILDFGLARPSEGNTNLTQSGLIVGTPTYMAPEQARGGVLDARADLYSLGCVLYRLSTGRVPFEGPDTMTTLVTAAVDPPKPPRELNPEVPQELNDLTLKLLEKDPARRPDSAKAVADVLRNMLTGSPSTNSVKATQATENIDVEPDEKTEAMPPKPRKRKKRRAERKWLWPAAAGGILAFVGIVMAAIYMLAQYDKGTLRIEALDEDAKVLVERDGNVVKVIDRNSGAEARLPGGQYHLRVSDPAKVKINKDTVTIARGKEEVARIERLSSPAQAQTSPIKRSNEGKPPLDSTLPAKAPIDDPKSAAPISVDFHRIMWRYASGGGHFEHTSGNDWLETGGSGPSCKWKEIGRTAEYVELFDQTRDLTVRLHGDRQMDNFNGTKPFRKIRDGEWEKVFTGLTRTQFNEVFEEYSNLKPNKWHPVYVKGYDGKEERFDIIWRSALIPGGWSMYSNMKSHREFAAKDAELAKKGTPIIVCDSRFKINGQEVIAAIWIGGQRNFWKQTGGSTFEHINGDQWLGKTPVRTYQYVEQERNDEFIDLFDRPGNTRVRLYFDHRDVFIKNKFEKRWEGKWEVKPAGN